MYIYSIANKFLQEIERKKNLSHGKVNSVDEEKGR